MLPFSLCHDYVMMWGDNSQRVRAILGENMCPTSLTPYMNYELDWSM